LVRSESATGGVGTVLAHADVAGAASRCLTYSLSTTTAWALLDVDGTIEATTVVVCGRCILVPYIDPFQREPLAAAAERSGTVQRIGDDNFMLRRVRTPRH
jgi:hypothetical protein